MLLIAECYVCGSTNIISSIDKTGFTHLLCKDCHLIRLHPKHLISNRDVYIDEYFNGSRYRTTDGKLGYPESYSDLANSYRQRQYAHYASELVKLLQQQHLVQPKVLDFGCGYGVFLKALSLQMKDVEVHGLEINPKVCKRASDNLNGGPIYCVDLKQDQGVVPQEYFDAITLLDVIEHLDDPRTYLAALKKCCKHGGYLLISTPNIESVNARIYRDKWVLHSPPYHTYYFGPRSLSFILKHSGWKLRYLYTERTIFHNERFGMETWKGRLLRHLFQHRTVDILTNQFLKTGSIMIAVAQRN